MQLSDEQRALLSLHMTPGIGPRLAGALLAHFGSARAVLEASVDELCEIPHLGAKLAAKMKERRGDVDAELARLDEYGVRLLFHGDADFPVPLASIDPPPPQIYVKGTILEQDTRAIAIVGSRGCTSYGKRVAERLANDLSRAGYTIVSGLARGIDGCAHRATLEAGGRTLAVLAGGLSRIYPPEHAELAEQVAKSGALITEACLMMEPMPGMFPSRNRIISGLSLAVVIVEAALKSGALITARHALEQGREVFAIPGPVDSLASGGTLQLLRDGARLARHAGDIIEDLGGIPGAAPEPATCPPGLSEVEEKIWTFLSEARNVDDLCRHVEQPIAELSALLMTLELKGILRRLPGNKYERV